MNESTNLMTVTQSRLHKSDLLDQFWTDVPVVPDIAFILIFHRSKRAKRKQHVLIESCLIEKRLNLHQKKLQRKTGTIIKELKIETFFTFILLSLCFIFQPDIFT